MTHPRGIADLLQKLEDCDPQILQECFEATSEARAGEYNCGLALLCADAAGEH